MTGCDGRGRYDCWPAGPDDREPRSVRAIPHREQRPTRDIMAAATCDQGKGTPSPTGRSLQAQAPRPKSDNRESRWTTHGQCGVRRADGDTPVPSSGRRRLLCARRTRDGAGRVTAKQRRRTTQVPLVGRVAGCAVTAVVTGTNREPMALRPEQSTRGTTDRNEPNETELTETSGNNNPIGRRDPSRRHSCTQLKKKTSARSK